MVTARKRQESIQDVPLTLSKEWRYYEIPLSSFHPTDLSEIFMVVGFVFEKDATNIHVRNIEYVR